MASPKTDRFLAPTPTTLIFAHTTPTDHPANIYKEWALAMYPLVQNVVIARITMTLQSTEAEIPLELLFEILSYLGLYDLLKLAWVNKSFGSLLTSRSSTFLWRRARINADNMPNPPFDMSEPAHARLIFVNHCSVRTLITRDGLCLSMLLSVLQNPLRESYMCVQDPLLQEVYGDQVHSYRSSLSKVPQTAESTSNDNFDTQTDEGSFIRRRFGPWISCKIEQYNNIKTVPVANGKHAENIVNRLSVKLHDKVVLNGKLEEKALVEGWQIEVERFRMMKSCFVSTVAYNSVKINKKTKKDLVQDNWLRLRPLVLEPLQRQRRFLLGQAMHQRLTILHETYTRFQSLHVRNAIWPSLGDLIVRDGPVKELLQTTPLDRNPGVTIRDTEFRLNVTKTFVAPRFAQFSHTWRLDKEKELYQMLRGDAVSITSNDNDLCLATTVF
ncbi:hypothetical protein FB446DRAFT_811183 [Lentinula raphanica]|nr:hypothetical protein FB446DRAFT_811183 [Lentinula raphanica]